MSEEKKANVDANKKADEKKQGVGGKGKNFRKQQESFVGAVEELRGSIYHNSNATQADTFAETNKALADYVGRTMNYGGDIRSMITTMEVPTILAPVAPADGANLLETELFKESVKEYAKRRTALRENTRALYSIIWGQCTKQLRDKVQSMTDFNDVESEQNGLELLKLIRSVVYNYQDEKDEYDSVDAAMHRYYGLKQGKYESVSLFLQRFQNTIEVTECTGGLIGYFPDLIEKEYKSKNITPGSAADTEAVQSEVKNKAREKYLARSFFLKADKTRYGVLLESTRNSYLQGNDVYPSTVTQACNILTNWKHNPNLSTPSLNNDGIAFAQDGEVLTNEGRRRGRRGGDKKHITCYKCKGTGHYANECEATEVGTTLINQVMDDDDFDDNHGYQLAQYYNDQDQSTDIESDDDNGQEGYVCKLGSSRRIPLSWVLLDNQSTIDVFCNGDLLTNIRPSNTSMTIHCNAGRVVVNEIGDVVGYGTVWYYPEGIANIFSLSRMVEKGFHVEYNSNDGVFYASRDNQVLYVFRQSEGGLFYSDSIIKQPEGTALINTVEDNKRNYSNRDYQRAVLARNIQKIVGRPSYRDFLAIIDNNQIPNCPITKRDAIIAERIFGPEVGSLKGKTVRRTPEPVHLIAVDLPPDIMATYRDVVLAADIMFVNKIAFFVTISRHIRFCTCEMIYNRKTTTILTALKAVHRTYMQRGFRITNILMDGEFNPLRGDLAELGIALNSAANDEHVPEVERHIRTIKERTRAVYNMLPFQQLPARIVIELVYYSVFWINSFPHRNGISQVLSPRTIITGQLLDYNKHCRLEFGSYVQTHEEHDNSMATRTTGAIALRPTGNAQGSFLFYSLNTGRVLTRNQWTPLPMPNDVITRIHILARRDRTNIGGLFFADRHGQPDIDPDDDDDDDESWHPDPHQHDDEFYADDDDLDPDADPDDDDNIVPIAGVPDNHNDNAHNHHHNDNVQDGGFTDQNNADQDDNDDNDPNDVTITGVTAPGDNTMHDVIDITDDDNMDNDVDNVIDVNDNDDGINFPNEPVSVATEMDTKYGKRSGRYDLRDRKPRTYDHLHTVLHETLLTQHGLKKGLQLYGQNGADAVIKELKQLDTRDVLEPIQAASLTRAQRIAALAYLMFLKEKRTGEIKGRGCADGRKQRLYTKKEEASSPTVANEAIFLSCLIDAYEGRDVAIVDIPGAFLHAFMKDVVHLRFEGVMAEMLVSINPEKYGKFIVKENGKTVLYLLAKKALYGTLKAALLFWEKLTGSLKSWGFEINPYDRCVANKTINGKQCTIIWHVDDLKISHVDSKVVDDVIRMINEEYGKEAPLTVHRGKIHEYLGMTIDYSESKKVKFTMIDYIKSIINEAPADMSGIASTPAGSHLFEVNQSNPKHLDKKTADLFHHLVAKLLFLCKRARPDIQTAVAFLCTRVKKPDEDDYKKLGRVIRYLRGTQELPLILKADGFSSVAWWVDASFAVHPDMRSHTGGMMSLGSGAVYATSTRQKLNTKSSTEAELVAVSEVLPQILWTRNFLQSQGYDVDASTIFQDNQSAILLEENGRASSSKRTRHMNIRYFFVTDHVGRKEIKIVYCPTAEMVGDFFTKPLQGSLFTRFRDRLLNATMQSYVDPASKLTQDHRSVLEKDECKAVEHVGTQSGLESGLEMDGGWTKVTARKKRSKRKLSSL